MNLDDLPGPVCIHCGRPIPETLRADAIFCSEKCRTARTHALDKAARAEARRGLVCRICGVSFDGARSHQTRCSRECRNEDRRRKRCG